MIITITIILSFLVALNFLLLLFSCNKVTRRSAADNSMILAKYSSVKTVKAVKAATAVASVKVTKPAKLLTSSQLAPTGS